MRTLFALSLLLFVPTCVRAAMPPHPQLDGEDVYRQNCRRCHTAIHTFSPRMMGTVVHHMQVRAMLTRDEQAAVLAYLLESSPAKKIVTPRPPAARERTDP